MLLPLPGIEPRSPGSLKYLGLNVTVHVEEILENASSASKREGLETHCLSMNTGYL
jgi:hypothetical protein